MEKFLDAILREALKHLQEAVNIIDKDYKRKWTTTAVDEKIRFFSKSDINTIFQTFPVLTNPLGHTLVSFLC